MLLVPFITKTPQKVRSGIRRLGMGAFLVHSSRYLRNIQAIGQCSHVGYFRS